MLAVSRERSGPARADWADPRRLADLAEELHHARPRAPSARNASRPRDRSGRVLSALKVTIRLGGSGTVRYFDTWKQLTSYLSGEDFKGIAGRVRSIEINQRPSPER
jgi:hypothetical protein